MRNEKLPNTMKILLEKGKLVNNEWNDNIQLNSIINDCISIENSIKTIHFLDRRINNVKINNNNIKICFSPENEDFDKFISKVKTFGSIII